MPGRSGHRPPDATPLYPVAERCRSVYVHLVPAYRLIADHGHPTHGFEAENDQEAERQGRIMADSTSTAKVVGYRVEIHEAGTRRTVAAWLPRRIVSTSGPRDALVHPDL